MESPFKGGDLSAYLTPDDNDTLARALASARGYCGWHVTPEIREEITVDASGEGVVYLRSLHVTEIHTVTVDGEPQNIDGLRWAQNGLIYARWCGRVVVDLTHGYAAAEDFTNAVLESAARRRGLKPGAFPKSQVTVGQRTEQYAVPYGYSGGSSLTDADLSAFDRYKIPTRP